MRKSIICIVALILSLSFLLISCGDVVNNDSVSTDSVGDSASVDSVDSNTENVETTEEATTEAPDESPYVVVETFVDEKMIGDVYDLFVAGKGLIRAPLALEAPYVTNDVTKISDCKLLSMTVPVQKTTKLDDGGNFILTLIVYDSSFSGLQAEPKRTYPIKINAEQYGIKANDSKVKKVIDVDLSSYDIVLTEKETIGYFAKDDTLFPAMLKASEGNLVEPFNEM